MIEATATPKKAVKRAPKASPKPLAPRTSKGGLFATIATGGKQYRVQAGDTIKIEKQVGEYKEGDSLKFVNVLLIDNGMGEITLGKPFIEGAVISAILKKLGRYKTIDVIKYKQKSRYFKKYGHRQPYFEVQIDSVK